MSEPNFFICNQDPIIASCILSSIEKSFSDGFSVINRNVDFIKAYLKGKSSIALSLKTVLRDESGYRFYFNKINRNTLVYTVWRYRCPGPIAEILLFIRRNPDKAFDLYIFSDRLNPDSLLESLELRGYHATTVVSVEKEMTKLTISSRNTCHDSAM